MYKLSVTSAAQASKVELTKEIYICRRFVVHTTIRRDRAVERDITKINNQVPDSQVQLEAKYDMLFGITNSIQMINYYLFFFKSHPPENSKEYNLLGPTAFNAFNIR